MNKYSIINKILEENSSMNNYEEAQAWLAADYALCLIEGFTESEIEQAKNNLAAAPAALQYLIKAGYC
jgi:hypothetical protein